jgi:MscS family membrane protein
MNVRFSLRPIVAAVLLLVWQPAVPHAEDAAPPPADPHPLAPADTSSPRDTLLGFEANITRALRAWQAGEPRDAVLRYGRLAFSAFDFSHLPSEERLAREIEATLLLKEILDRIDLPPEQEIPGDQEVANKELPVTSWSIPYTEISIAKVEQGPRAGQYLFTPESVDRLEEFYERAKHLPYKPGAFANFYDTVRHSPGLIVPASWTNTLPGWSKTVILGKTAWQWIFFAITVIASFLAVRALLRWGRRWDKRHRGAGALMRFGRPLSVIASVLVVYAARVALLFGARFFGDFWDVFSSVVWILIFAGIGWLIVLVTNRVADAINEARRIREGSIDEQLVRTVLRLVSLVALVLVGLYAVNFFGVPLTPVIASLGVGGLAVALAVRPTLENIIGGLTLFADKPVRIGEFCRFGNDEGTVEEIGLRSTRIRKQDDTLVSLPNADFSQRELTNYTRRRLRLYQTTLGLRYETTSEQLRFVIANLREMLLAHPKVSPEKLHVRFDGFGPYSLDVELFAYIRTPEWLEYLAIREDINFRIIDIVKDAGTGFAFPSQTTYLGRDSGLDTERGQQAESAVGVWRATGQLPFPDFSPTLRWEKEDTLDYPPQGSPDFTPRHGLAEAEPEQPAKLDRSPPRPRDQWRRFMRLKRH